MYGLAIELIDIFCTLSHFVFVRCSQKKLFLDVSPNKITDFFTLRHLRNKIETPRYNCLQTGNETFRGYDVNAEKRINRFVVFSS